MVDVQMRIVFSMAIVALRLASLQFGPRLLRNFMVDRGTQIAFGTFAGLISEQGVPMLKLALFFLVIAIIAAIFGFGGIASAAAAIAKILFFIFFVVFVVLLIIGVWIGKKLF